MNHPHQAPALLDPDAVLHRIAERLATRFTGTVSPETVDRYVHESYVALHRTTRVHQHLTALAEYVVTAVAELGPDLAPAYPTPPTPPGRTSTASAPSAPTSTPASTPCSPA